MSSPSPAASPYGGVDEAERQPLRRKARSTSWSHFTSFDAQLVHVGELPFFTDAAALNHLRGDGDAGGHGGAPELLEPGSVRAAVFTLSSMSLGVGIFVLPQVFADVGVVAGGLALLGFALWSYAMQLALIRACAVVEARQGGARIGSLEELVDAALGTYGRAALSLTSAFTMLVGNAGHMKTIVQLLHNMLEWYVTGTYGVYHMTTVKELALYLVLLSSILMFCVGSRISSLRYVSTFTVGVVLLLSLWCTGEALFWYAPHGTSAITGDTAPPLASGDWKKYASDLPAIAFTFSSVFVLFPVLSELQKREFIQPALQQSTALCGAMYLFVALIATLVFGTSVVTDPFRHKSASNYLYVFPPSHYGVTMLCGLLIVAITLLYPIINFPFIKSVEKLVTLLPGLEDVTFAWPHRLAVTLFGMGLVLAINLSMKSLVSIFGLCGGWGVGSVSFIIPAAVGLAVDDTASAATRCFYALSGLAMLALNILFTYVTFF